MDPIVNSLLTGHVSEFKKATPEKQSSVLKQLSATEFQRNIYTPDFHKKFLAAINNNVTDLTFCKNPLLKDKEMLELIRRMPKLKNLKLQSCNIAGFTSEEKSIFGTKPSVFWLTDLCDRKVNISIIDSSNPKLRTMINIIQSLRDLNKPNPVELALDPQLTKTTDSKASATSSSSSSSSLHHRHRHPLLQPLQLQQQVLQHPYHLNQ